MKQLCEHKSSLLLGIKRMGGGAAKRLDNSSSLVDSFADANVDVAAFGNSRFNSKPASSAICFIRLSVCASGDIVPIALLMVLSIVFVCTSKSSNCFSNLSIICEIFSKFIDLIAESMAFVTPPIDCAIDLVATAVCTRLATASTRLAIRKKFNA
ncbi:hypothetical protein DERF_008617 [Dermatophagoides farinae]|uniref:Uncharacterized protein n=1 Tax=Dermatophagoides farinae TaxID=6954 RepID=A0A922I213_DERFA|nr:hypothetical protein DERF_008617 [Dermatophagoides farinae]